MSQNNTSENSATNIRVIVIDDEQGILNAVKRLLMPEGYQIETFSNPFEALQRFTKTRFDIVISDYRMPKIDGIALLISFKEVRPEAMRIILSGNTDMEAVVDAINNAEIYRFIAKPWDDYEFRITIAKAVEFYRIKIENARLVAHVKKQHSILEELEAKTPGISVVQWANDGSIVLK